ncbi:hypothetical protein [Campylobacter mucosalis]|uniref:Uncharacterized protein n=1 Tax=Campylobacter mucosalis CCUG 21559 TaxID=1032067 RepID=A0A6G5QEM2_9BACT|nr:hypothetical protein [Campylobacter mucosalis]QCD44101.1 hypothetical protein CMUC_0287 [Campylobacter mucosalis CCUG 21559]
MTDKEIALELTKIVVNHTRLKTHTDIREYDNDYNEIPKVDVAKELADIYNTIYAQIHDQE